MELLKEIGRAFGIEGEFIEGGPYGSGHINDTYAVSYLGPSGRVRYIHQRINHLIFKDPPALMENISRVTAHQQSRLKGLPESERRRRSLTTLPAARGGLPYHRDAQGNYWRTYHFIEGAKTYDVIESNAQAEEAARAFGEFQGSLADLSGGRLHETIPGFHDTPKRFKALLKALDEDPLGRLKDCRAEADFIRSQAPKVSRLVELFASGKLPERVTHNDTKLNNVMLDDATGEGVCVIDLDTVMPGLAAYDFGEMVRTATLPCREDETDLGKVLMQWDKFESVARGYIRGAGAFLTPLEREQLAFGGWIMPFENGMRFLTDHLNGDSYFKIKRPGQNLDRSRTQLALARDVDRHLAGMEAFISQL